MADIAVNVDVRQEYSEALAMCKQAAAEAAEENNVKRSKNVKAIALMLVLLLIVVLGMRRTLRPAKAVHVAPPRPLDVAVRPTPTDVAGEARKAEVQESAPLPKSQASDIGAPGKAVSQPSEKSDTAKVVSQPSAERAPEAKSVTAKAGAPKSG
eukprot:TRINITY_DN66125_c0_g1_i1.p2 TRINITY_DN66125_c0_g1~~TRINITY_DN66125_c0_g1_i1.p2  ORF type:complete len:154 (+),score=9.68 TRINITY_DN66125_c0_g1_i1:155-616(+)